jgi:hypothetical protein
MCPFGNDILDVSDDLDDYQHNVQQLAFVSNYYNGTGDLTDLNDETFALTFTSRLNETFTTIPIVFDGSSDTDMRNDIQLALLSLPNRVIDGVSVSISRTNTQTLYGSPAAYTTEWANKFSTMGTDWKTLLDNVLLVKITFTGSAVQGRQNYLQVEDYECNDGCTPKLSGLSLQYKYDHFVSNITDIYESTTSSDGGFMNVADFNSYECGRRGKCDYNTGLCQCFAGYFGDNCNTLTTLV